MFLLYLYLENGASLTKKIIKGGKWTEEPRRERCEKFRKLWAERKIKI